MVSWSRGAYVDQSRPGLAKVRAMRAMGVDLLSEPPPDDRLVAEGRATVWVSGPGVLRARFVDASGVLTDHGLESELGSEEVGSAELGSAERRRLLLISSREADVHGFVERLPGEGWREVAWSRPGRATGVGYFLALVEHPSQT